MKKSSLFTIPSTGLAIFGLMLLSPMVWGPGEIPVPEPSSIALMGVGIIGVLVTTLKKRPRK